MRVTIADDTLPFAKGLADMLTEIGVEVVAIARDTDELLAAVDRDPPDVAIVDVSMPPTFTDEGLLAAETLAARHPGVGVLIVSAYDEDGWPTRLLHHRPHGVGYLRKRNLDDIAAIRDALHRIRAGGIAIDQDIAERVLAQRSVTSRLGALTPREKSVLQRMAEGRSNYGVAAALEISERTVERHVTRIFEKLGLEHHDDDNLRVRAVLDWFEGDRSNVQ